MFSSEETGAEVGSDRARAGPNCSKYRDGPCLPLRASRLLFLRAAPDICPVFQILGEPKQNRKLVAEASLRNPLTMPLLGCTFTMEGAGLTEEQKIMDV